MTLAVDDDLWALVKIRYAGRAMTTVAVRGELSRLRGHPDHSKARLAKRAFLDWQWLGDPFVQDGDEERMRIERLREHIAGGKPGHELEHLGEASCIVLAQDQGGQLIADDYDARVKALEQEVTPASVHTLLHLLAASNVIPLEEAHGYVQTIRDAKRGPDVTLEELLAGGRAMGRVGMP